MEYQKSNKLVRKSLNQPTNFRTKNQFKINDGSRETYNTNSEINFKTSMLRSISCDYLMCIYL